MATFTYLHLKPGDPPPDFPDAGPFKAVLVIEQPVTPEWQAQVSDWLVRSGCLYMMAWGCDCSSWDDSVDCAYLAAFDFKEAPKDLAPMTTWHEDESLEEVMRFATHSAFHPTVDLPRLLIIQISAEAREGELLQAVEEARQAAG